MAASTDRAGITWEEGAWLEAQDTTLKWYRAKIIDIKEDKSKVLVHFDGWNSRWDDWFPMTSERLRPCSKIADWRDKKRDKKSPLRVNQRVLARWKSLSLYPARITALNPNGTYRVMFHDGYEQNVTAGNIKTASANELNKIQKEIESKQWLQPQVAGGKRQRKPVKSDESFVTEPFVRRKSSETKGEAPQVVEKKEKKEVEKKVKESPAAILRRLKTKKNRSYLKLGQAIPDEVDGTGTRITSPPSARAPTSPEAGTSGTGGRTTEESYDSFKASTANLPTKRRRVSSQHSSGRTTPTETDQSATSSVEHKGDVSPTKVKVKTALHAKMARVREVCNKWKKEKEKKTVVPKSPSHIPETVSDYESSAEVPSEVVSPSRSSPLLATSTPLSLAIETGASRMEEPTSPVVSFTRLEVGSSGRSSPSISEKSVDRRPSLETPKTPATPATPITPLTPLTPSTPGADLTVDKNKYPCPHCSRGFRKENLLNYHLKYYHSDETGVPLQSVVPADELEIARKKPDPVKREDRKRSRDEDHTRHPIFTKRRSEDSSRSTHNILFDTKRQSTGSFTESELELSMNAGDTSLVSSSGNHGNLNLSTASSLDLNQSRDFGRESTDIKPERRDSLAVEESSIVSDSENSVRTERERYDSFGLDSVVSEDQESVVGEERREEVINCPCGFTEENGLMIQCEVCLCWQHVFCIRLSEDKLPIKYICWVCVNPPGIRESRRYIHDQEWLKEGQITRFSYLARTRDSVKRAPVLKAVAGLVSDVHNVSQVLAGLKRTGETASGRGGAETETDALYSSLEAALAHGTIPALPDQDVELGNRSHSNQPAMSNHSNELATGNHSNESATDNHSNELATDNHGNENEAGKNQMEPENSEQVEKVENNADTTGQSLPARNFVNALNSDLDQKEETVEKPDSNNGEETAATAETEKSDNAESEAKADQVPKENGDSLTVDPIDAEEIEVETTVSTAASNGTNALSDHSYLQTGERRSVATFANHDYARESRGENDDDTCETMTMTEAQLKLNLYIRSQQDLIDGRLDLIEQQVAILEEMEVGGPTDIDYDPLADVGLVKKNLRGLIQDLHKVKRMATYSVNRR